MLHYPNGNMCAVEWFDSVERYDGKKLVRTAKKAISMPGDGHKSNTEVSPSVFMP